jgi:hypothetical protein
LEISSIGANSSIVAEEEFPVSEEELVCTTALSLQPTTGKKKDVNSIASIALLRLFFPIIFLLASIIHAISPQSNTTD